MALTFVVHSGYVNATTMTCFGSGRVEVSLSGDDFCCIPTPLEAESLSPKCCDFKVSEKVFDSISDGGFQLTLLPLELPVIGTEFGIFLFSTEEVDFESLTSPPERLYGLSLLKFISVFRL